MLRDGHALNDAILDVIEIQPTARNLTHNANVTKAVASHTAIENQWPSGEHAHYEPMTLTQNSSGDASILPGGSNMPNTNEIYIDGLNAAENPFTFDMADLQWLDSVQ